MTGGWFRLWRDGPGLSWRNASDGLYFSERYGKASTFRIGSVRFRLLPPIKRGEN